MKNSKLYCKFKIIFETFFIYYRLYFVSLNEIKIKEIKIGSNYQFKILTIEDLELFDFFELSNYYIKIYAERLNNKDFICFGMIDLNNNKLAYYSWLNFENKTYCKEIKRNLKLKKTNACLFEDDNTHIDYRNCKLHTYIMNERLKYCASKNLNKAYIIIHPLNIPAIKTIQKFGFKKTIHIPIKYRDNSIQYLINKLKQIGKFSQ
jgi:hypothetical protein